MSEIQQNQQKIYKLETFEQFLKLIKEGPIEHWTEVAKALGVDRETVAKWRNHPKAKEAIAEGIAKTIKKMEESGKGDWRMWLEKLKMFGIGLDEAKTEVIQQVNVEVITGLPSEKRSLKGGEEKMSEELTEQGQAEVSPEIPATPTETPAEAPAEVAATPVAAPESPATAEVTPATEITPENAATEAPAQEVAATPAEATEAPVAGGPSLQAPAA